MSTYTRRAMIIAGIKKTLEDNRAGLGNFLGDVILRYDKPGMVAERSKFPVMYLIPMMHDGDQTTWTNSPILQHEFPLIVLGYYKTTHAKYEADLLKIIEYSDNCLDLFKPPNSSISGGAMVTGSYQRLGSMVPGDFVVIWFVNIFMVKAML